MVVHCTLRSGVAATACSPGESGAGPSMTVRAVGNAMPMTITKGNTAQITSTAVRLWKLPDADSSDLRRARIEYNSAPKTAAMITRHNTITMACQSFRRCATSDQCVAGEVVDVGPENVSAAEQSREVPAAHTPPAIRPVTGCRRLMTAFIFTCPRWLYKRNVSDGIGPKIIPTRAGRCSIACTDASPLPIPQRRVMHV